MPVTVCIDEDIEKSAACDSSLSTLKRVQVVTAPCGKKSAACDSSLWKACMQLVTAPCGRPVCKAVTAPCERPVCKRLHFDRAFPYLTFHDLCLLNVFIQFSMLCLKPIFPNFRNSFSFQTKSYADLKSSKAD
ncbi:unnamed protein product [Rodentolepis nana]|uniref:GDNF domain-containing protein n=1 Tax=Rodentolepis nana TaxID=102285 RepID=A0A0R3THJ8_RODNA|nr:unnamed protein product [Rodentolepis nana]